MDYIDLDKPLYTKDKNTGNIHPVAGISYPGRTPSGKDIAVCVEDYCEWREYDEVELMPQNYIPQDDEKG